MTPEYVKAGIISAEELKAVWQKEESLAKIRGWDFSHIRGRYEEEDALPWDYAAVIGRYLKSDMKLLDYDTGGGEFLLSLGHPYENTCATEGYPPNVRLCEERLLPLGVDLRACDNASKIPFADGVFDIVINRHGDFDPAEIRRLLKPGGYFVTQQVGGENDRELVEAVLPDAPPPFPHNNLKEQKKAFEDAGFEILQADEAFGPIVFYDVGAFVWFARIIEWEFTGFSVERCFPRLLDLQKTLERDGKIAGTVHRYLIAARKPEKSDEMKKRNVPIDVSQLSSRFAVRRLSEGDAGMILQICLENPQYYLYRKEGPSVEQALEDLVVTPPGIGPEDKYYVGFFENGTPVAVMDLIGDYPSPDVAFIGFFMMAKAYQGRQIGSGIIRETALYLKSTGKTAIRLAIDKGNPQSSHFWQKNGFTVIKEADRNGHTLLVAERKL